MFAQTRASSAVDTVHDASGCNVYLVERNCRRVFWLRAQAFLAGNLPRVLPNFNLAENDFTFKCESEKCPSKTSEYILFSICISLI